MVFTLNRFILLEKEKNPIYESLAQRVKRLLDRSVKKEQKATKKSTPKAHK